MRKYFERAIYEKNYRTTSEMFDRLSKAAAAGLISAEDKIALDADVMAAADKDENQPELRQMVLDLADRVATLEVKLGTGDTPEDDGDGYPAWKPWDGISTDYQPGAIVTHNGKLWQSVYARQNTWEPGVTGTEALWREVHA